MGISIDNVWAMAQRLSPSERLALSRRLAKSVTETTFSFMFRAVFA